ncbi:MAG: hypothetical protein Q8P57_03670 [Candidatus Pacearchaeota archaeon]|nr:hypothetical protein [Candidatus Pacearchaeota archaeon]
MERKGQAAMEFLMTYGWAILAAIIAIGVLAYFGVFNPGRLAGPAGIISPPFNLDDFNIVDGGLGADVVNMIVTQNLGSNVNLVAGSEFVFTLPDSSTCSVTSDPAGIISATPADWTSGTQVTFTATCEIDSWGTGDAVRGDITISYTKSGSSLTQVTQGNLRGPSQ